LESHAAGDLDDRYNNAFKARNKDYRNPQIHDWGFPAVGRSVPKREYLNKWADKDLGEFDRLLSENNVTQRIVEEFTDAVAQARDDLMFAETVINDIWEVALTELSSMTEKDRYRGDQPRDLDRDPPQRPAERVSSKAASTSRTVGIPKK
jgi:hypothetical protein